MSKTILTIDTVSNPSCLGLVKGNQIIAQKNINRNQISKEELSLHLNELISNNLDSPKNIDAIAIIIGPGSFTSLRAGLSLAKGITFAVKKPLIAISTFYAMVVAYQYENSTEFEKLIPLVDARKGRFFKSEYSKSADKMGDPELVDLSYLHSIKAKNSIVLPLTGIKLEDFDSTPPLQYKTIQLLPIHVSMAAIQKGEFLFNEKEIAYLEPDYLVNNYKK